MSRLSEHERITSTQFQPHQGCLRQITLFCKVHRTYIKGIKNLIDINKDTNHKYIDMFIRYSYVDRISEPVGHICHDNIYIFPKRWHCIVVSFVSTIASEFYSRAIRPHLRTQEDAKEHRKLSCKILFFVNIILISFFSIFSYSKNPLPWEWMDNDE